MLQNGNVWNGNDMMGMIQNGNDTEWEWYRMGILHDENGWNGNDT
jgi:hypothetical protein